MSEKLSYATKVRVYTVPVVADACAEHALVFFGGYTLFDSVGGWDSEAHGPIVEGGKVLEVIVHGARRPRIAMFLATVDHVAANHGEDCVLVTEEPVRSQLRFTS